MVWSDFRYLIGVLLMLGLTWIIYKTFDVVVLLLAVAVHYLKRS